MGQYFKYLNYTLGDEDPTPEKDLLPFNSKHAMAVADCGSRIVPLLARRPSRLSCVDISAPQLAVCELRLALLRACDLDTYKRFLGYAGSMGSAERKAIFFGLRMTAASVSLLEEMFNGIDWGPILYCGQFERMLKKISKVTRLLTGAAGSNIFNARTIEEQQDYYQRYFPKLRWAFVLRLLGNSTALNSLLYRGDFPKKNIEGSHFKIYQSIFERLLTQFSARRSFFLQMVFFGEIRYEEGLPLECSPEIFAEAKAALETCEVEFLAADVFTAAARVDRPIDFLSLSDVPSFLPSRDEPNFLQQLRPGLADDALVVVRAHLRRPAPSTDGFLDVSMGYIDTVKNELTQLWSFHIFRPI